LQIIVGRKNGILKKEGEAELRRVGKFLSVDFGISSIRLPEVIEKLRAIITTH